MIGFHIRYTHDDSGDRGRLNFRGHVRGSVGRLLERGSSGVAVGLRVGDDTKMFFWEGGSMVDVRWSMLIFRAREADIAG